MTDRDRHILVVGGGTAGAVLAGRLSEDARLRVTLLEAGPDHDSYDGRVLDPIRATESWAGEGPHLARTEMATETGSIPMSQGRVLGGTSAINAMATLRGQPADYDAWAAAGLEGWGWEDVADTFIAAERDMDFGATPIHGGDGPLPVRRWRREELSHSQRSFYDAMIEVGQPAVTDINDPGQLPGIGIFPVTVDEQTKRVTTSLAYLDEKTRARDNLVVRANAEVARIEIDAGRASGVVLVDGEEIEADEVAVAAGALWSPTLLLRSGVGPTDHLAEHGIGLQVDLPVGSTMSDHLGPGIPYRHEGPRGGSAGPAQVVYVGASDGNDVDYHLMPISPQDPDGATADSTAFVLAVFLLRSSGRGSVRLGATPEAGPVVVAPPLPDDGHARLRHAFDKVTAWERSAAFREGKLEPLLPRDLQAPDAVAAALEANTVSYAHMAGTCPMGPVLDADCRVHGIPNLRVADASVMPTIPRGNTYLGCVMVAERIARKMKAG